MYKSAKVKAREFMKTLDSDLPLEATLDLPFGLVTELVYKLLLEHERDTRNCVIDEVLTLERFTGSVSEEGWDMANTDTVSLDSVTHIIHNTNVGV